MVIVGCASFVVGLSSVAFRPSGALMSIERFFSSFPMAFCQSAALCRAEGSTCRIYSSKSSCFIHLVFMLSRYCLSCLNYPAAKIKNPFKRLDNFLKKRPSPSIKRAFNLCSNPSYSYPCFHRVVEMPDCENFGIELPMDGENDSEKVLSECIHTEYSPSPSGPYNTGLYLLINKCSGL